MAAQLLPFVARFIGRATADEHELVEHRREETDDRLEERAIRISHEGIYEGARSARFQREAEVLASLNHPHIATIYGLEESGE